VAKAMKGRTKILKKIIEVNDNDKETDKIEKNLNNNDAVKEINDNEVVAIDEESYNDKEEFGSSLVTIVGDAVNVQNTMRKFICFNE